MVLSDLLNNAFLQYRNERHLSGRWESFDSFFYKKHECLGLLYHILDLGYDHADIMPDNLYRCQHTFVTFLLGWAIAKRYSLLDNINEINPLPDEYLWILTSLVHDYGYIKTGLAQKESIEVIDGKYHLLSDSCSCKQLESTIGYSLKYPQYLTYSYETISNYFNYRHSTLKPNLSKDHEANDHGIYGACKCYEEYCDFFIKEEYPRSCITMHDNADDIRRLGYDHYVVNNTPGIVELAKTEPLLYKTACLITAQHNMFRSSNPTSDIEYEKYGLHPLLSTEPIVIDKNNPLLFLLSLVDTIECTKRFEKLLLPNENLFHIPIEKVINNMWIEFNDDGIVVDYSSLFSTFSKYHSLLYSKKKREVLHNELDNHMRSVKGLKDWVKCETKQVKPFVVKILF